MLLRLNPHSSLKLCRMPSETAVVLGYIFRLYLTFIDAGRLFVTCSATITNANLKKEPKTNAKNQWRKKQQNKTQSFCKN
jgi:hypothetical protein